MEQARRILELLESLQLEGKVHTCPRCGENPANPDTVLSRYINIYICNDCGADEAIRDMAGDPLPFVKWDFDAAVIEALETIVK